MKEIYRFKQSSTMPLKLGKSKLKFLSPANEPAKPKTAKPVRKTARKPKKNVAAKRAGLVFLSLLCAGIFFVCSYCFLLKKDDKILDVQSSFTPANTYDLNLSNYDYDEILGTVSHEKPLEFGLHNKEYYPSYYNKIQDLTAEKKQALVDECNSVLNDTPNAIKENRLKKHVSADGQFYGIIDDATPRIIKKIHVNHAVPRRHSLSVFAPAGEVLTVKIDESMINKGLTVIVGYPYIENNVRSTNDFGKMTNTRMPIMYVSFKLDSVETKIGSPFGGMVCLEGPSGAEDFDIIISGGVDNPDYKLGVSTHEDWENIKKAPGLFVWMITPYVYHVMPKAYVQSIEDPYDALLFWHKSATLSYYTIGRDSDATPTLNVYDDFVPSDGGAVAFVPAYFCVCPSSWGTSAMNIEDIMYRGNWGNLHEFNHQNQNRVYASNAWGVGENGEVTNNVLNAMSYISYSQIGTTRTDTLPPTRNSNCWEMVTDPYYNYKKLLSENEKVSNFEGLGTNKLFAYIDLVHNFGIEKFADFVRAMYGIGDTFGFESLMTSKALTEENNFAIFACKYFQVDFCHYFQKVWKFALTQETINEIKMLGYPEFFTLNNVYSSGVKGVETGRPFCINAETENILDLENLTLCSADDFTLAQVGRPKNGKLVKLEDGKYAYTMNEGCDYDEFELKFSVTLNNNSYIKTLVVKLSVNAHYVDKTTYLVDNTSLSVFDAVKEATLANILSSTTTSNLTSTVDNGINLTHFSAKLVFPEDENVKFIVFGDDKTLLKIGENEAYTTTYIGNLQNALNAKTNTFELAVKKGEVYPVDAYCFNTGGIGGLNVRMSIDGGKSYTNIPDSYIFGRNIADENLTQYSKPYEQDLPLRFDLSKNYHNIFYKNQLSQTQHLKSITVQTPDGEPVISNGDTYPENMFDGTTSTFFHTAYTGQISPMPHQYIMEFEDSISFNRFTVRFWRGLQYAMGDFELYKSNDGQNYTMFYSGTNAASTCILTFDHFVDAKFVMLVVKSNAQGMKYTCITEIEFLQTNTTENFNIFASNNSNLIYQGQWTNQKGAFTNGYGANTTSGEIYFDLEGSDISIYSLNDDSKIFIDGIEHTIFKNETQFAPSFMAQLNDGTHHIKIVGQNFTLNNIQTSGTISATVFIQPGSGYLNLAEIIVISAAIFVTLSIISCLCVKSSGKKRTK